MKSAEGKVLEFTNLTSRRHWEGGGAGKGLVLRLPGGGGLGEDI